MASGPGYLDTNGVWFFGEDDDEGQFSETLNLASAALVNALLADRVRLAALEAEVAKVEHAEFTGTVSAANASATTFGTLTADTGASVNNSFAAVQGTGTIRLQPGVYAINARVTSPSGATGLSIAGLTFGTELFRSQYGDGSGAQWACEVATIRLTSVTDMVTYLYQTTGATRTITSRIRITRLG